MENIKTYIHVGNPVVNLKVVAGYNKSLILFDNIHKKINARGQMQHAIDWKVFGSWKPKRRSTYKVT